MARRRLIPSVWRGLGDRGGFGNGSGFGGGLGHRSDDGYGDGRRYGFGDGDGGYDNDYRGTVEEDERCRDDG